MTELRFGAGSRSAWQPTDKEIARARLTKLMRAEGIHDLAKLNGRAVRDPEWWWRAVVRDLGIRFSRPFSSVVGPADDPRLPSWFAGGQLNLVDSCVDRWAEGSAASKIAVIWEDEERRSRELTYGELAEESQALAAYLRQAGIKAGDRVGLFMPMGCETVVSFMACARIGAVVVPAFTGYGPDALATRFVGCGARAVICADGFLRRGKSIAMKDALDAALDGDSGVELVVTVPHVGRAVNLVEDRDVLWSQALALGRSVPELGGSEQLDSNHPLLLVYTSGTTGLPKGIVHSHGAFMAKCGLDWGYSFDVQEDDVLLWNTDMGWALGPMLVVGALVLGATLLLYDGSPDCPDFGRLWDMADRWNATTVGTSPSLIRSMMQQGDEVATAHDRSSLRAFVSTGEPWTPDAWHWLFDVVGEGRVPLINFAGGTEIGGGILTCYTIAPIAPCGFSGPVIGVDADVLNSSGKSVQGLTGELVIRNLFPGITHGFWEDRERYLDTYWSTWPGIWHHGDWAVHDADGYWFITGRSDDTLKISGKRVGPSEIESVLVRHDAIADAMVIAVPDGNTGSALVCFVIRTLAGKEMDEDQLRAELSASIVSDVDKTLRARRILFVEQLPKTRTGKLMRRVARARYLGLPQGDLSSMESPAAIDAIPVGYEVAQ